MNYVSVKNLKMLYAKMMAQADMADHSGHKKCAWGFRRAAKMLLELIEDEVDDWMS